jgi:hypothetical protein
MCRSVVFTEQDLGLNIQFVLQNVFVVAFVELHVVFRSLFIRFTSNMVH